MHFHFQGTSPSLRPAFGNWLLDIIRHFPLFTILPFLNLGGLLANLMRPIIAPQPEDLVQLRLSIPDTQRGEVILTRSQPGATRSSGRLGSSSSAPLIQVSLVNT